MLSQTTVTTSGSVNVGLILLWVLGWYILASHPAIT